jgi:hypothetical protein
MLPKSRAKPEDGTDDPRDVLKEPSQQVVEEMAGAWQPEVVSMWHFGTQSCAEGAAVHRASVGADAQYSLPDPELLRPVISHDAQFACTLMDGFDLFSRKERRAILSNEMR